VHVFYRTHQVRSQQVRLDAMPLADMAGARAATVRASLDTLVQRLRGLPPVELRVTRGEIVAETLHGRILIANEALADLPEGERLFVLAHELGHVMLEHWAQMGLLYQKWIPGEVVQHKTDAVSQQLGREGSALAQRQEIEADAFGLRTIRALGLSEQDAMNAFMHLGVRNDTATHPGTPKRIAAFRAIDADQLQAAVPAVPGR
jgi:Zn-dependent protease with chaperone function